MRNGKNAINTRGWTQNGYTMTFTVTSSNPVCSTNGNAISSGICEIEDKNISGRLAVARK